MNPDVEIVDYDVTRFRRDDLARFIREVEGGISHSVAPIEDIEAYSRKITALAEIILAVHQGRIVGTVVAYANSAPPQAAFITFLAVSVEYRGRGIGRRLLRAGVDRATSKGMRKVLLEVQRDNHAALALYRMNGFVPSDEGPGAMENTLLLLKTLG